MIKGKILNTRMMKLNNNVQETKKMIQWVSSLYIGRTVTNSYMAHISVLEK